MLNLLKSDFYRIVRDRQFWLIMALNVCICVLCAAMLSYLASPEFAAVVNDRAQENQPTEMVEGEQAQSEAEIAENGKDSGGLNAKVLPGLVDTWDSTLLEGGIILFLGSLAGVILLGRDFKGGFIRSLNMSKRGRRIYFSEKLVFIALLQLICIAVGICSAMVSYAVFGFTYATIESVGEMVSWIGLTWLLSCAYAYLVAILAWIVRSDTIPSIFAALVSTGIVGAIVLSAMGAFAQAYPWVVLLGDVTLINCSQLISGGNLLLANPALPIAGISTAAFSCLVIAIYLALFIAVVMLWCRKRDV